MDYELMKQEILKTAMITMAHGAIDQGYIKDGEEAVKILLAVSFLTAVQTGGRGNESRSLTEALEEAEEQVSFLLGQVEDGDLNGRSRGGFDRR